MPLEADMRYRQPLTAVPRGCHLQAAAIVLVYETWARVGASAAACPVSV